MFRIWYVPFYYYGVIHGDPHLGNYTVAPDNTVNLLDFGCVRIFPRLVRRAASSTSTTRWSATTATSPSTPMRAGASAICRTR